MADFEAGVGTLVRLGDQPVDVVLVVVEPTPKSIEVGTRAAALASERSGARVVIVASRVRSDDDLNTIRAAFPDHEVVAVPDDPAVVDAERRGLAPLDHAPDCPAVRALVDLAEGLAPVAA